MILACKTRLNGALRLCCCLTTLFSLICVAEDGANLPAPSALDRGFTGLYNLDFSGAQQEFSQWEKLHPEDPVGPVSEAAGFLFSEFNRLGVLEAQFYENDSAFENRTKLKPDPALRAHFDAAIARAQTLARARLATDLKES